MTPRPLRPQSSDGGLTINSVNMRGPAWAILDLTPLWLPPSTRGGDVPVLNLDGLRAYAPVIDETRYDLELVVSGYHTPEGVANTNPWAGLAENLDSLRTSVVGIPANASGTYASSLDVPGQSTRSAYVRVLPLVILEDPNLPVKTYTFTIEIPKGTYA